MHDTQEGQASLYTVISVSAQAHDVSAELIPVSKVRSGERLSPLQAEGIRIRKNGTEHVVILCHQELISEVDYFEAGGFSSYGKTMVFSSRNREGICVQY